MSMEQSKTYISYWIRRYFTEYLVTVRNKSHNTQMCYRDCMRMLLIYAAEQKGKRIDNLLVNDFKADTVLAFLNYLEEDRGCSITSRNNRRSALMTFFNFIAIYEPEYVELSRLAHLVPLKKSFAKSKADGQVKPLVAYLTKDEMTALLEAPDQSTEQGRRDYAVLMFLYNSGSRASEAANLVIKNIVIPKSTKDDGRVTILGKGDKVRTCPLWASTINLLRPLVEGREATAHVFLNRCGEPITRFGIYDMVDRYAKRASSKMPSIKDKHVSPHTIRHTTASMMLSAGIDINTIRAWLGHVSVNTTNIYAGAPRLVA